MKKTQSLIPLFKTFIRDTETGKRLKKNGERIKPASIANYRYVLHNLIVFSSDTDFELRVCDTSRLSQREYQSEKNYYKRFYKQFTNYLYKKGCHDNYVGSNIKTLRTFLNYLAHEKNINTGDFRKQLYVRKEEVNILVLSPEQLKFLIHDTAFVARLSPLLKRTKDVFVFGCTTGLRYSDIFLLTNKNFELQKGQWYLKMRSQKTKTYSYIKLPEYAAHIFLTYRSKSSKTPLFTPITLFNFNKNIKALGEAAGYTERIQTGREQQGKTTKKASQKEARFCDKMSSHMMRRTAITTLLILGMPEHLVRKISGHSASSASFNRYVHYAQAYIDREIDKVHEQLDKY